MQVAQRKKNKFTRLAAQAIGVTLGVATGVLGILPSVLVSSPCFAGLTGVAGSITYPTPQGFAYQTLEHGFGAQAEAWMDSPGFISHLFPQMHMAITYEPFTVRGLSSSSLTTLGITTGLGVNMIGAFVGLQALSGDFGNTFMPFFTVDVGAVFDTMTYINTSSVNANSGAALAVQLVPGFDLPLVSHVGLVVELPVKIYNLKNTFTIWDAVVGLRVKL